MAIGENSKFDSEDEDNEMLRAALTEDERPVTAKVLRKILREELRAP
jgi:hypothetical protein